MSARRSTTWPCCTSAQGRYAEAEPLYKRALAIREKALGPDHPDVGTSLNNLAGLYRAQGRYAEAEPLYKRGLAITEKALGPDHPDVGTSLNNLAVLYQRQGRYAEAEPLYKRGLAIREKALGPDHPDVGTSLNNLAALYHAQGRYAEAEPLYKRALAISEKALGPDHPDVGTSLNNLAVLYTPRAATPRPSRSTSAPRHPREGAGPRPPRRRHRRSTTWPRCTAPRAATPRPSRCYKRSLAISREGAGPRPPRGRHLAQQPGRAVPRPGPLRRGRAAVQAQRSPSREGAGPRPPRRRHRRSTTWPRSISRSATGRGAADYWRRSTGVIVRRAQRGTADVGQALTGKRKGEAEQRSYQFWGLVKVVHRLAAQDRSAGARPWRARCSRPRSGR